MITLENTLYAACRVRTPKALGSCTVIASVPDGENYSTFALTNWHVVENCIQVKKEFDPLVGKEIPRELKSVVEVDFPRYKGDRILGFNTVQADIVIYDKNQDIALLKFRDIVQYPSATLIPKPKIDDIRFLQEVVFIGAAVGEKPVGTVGLLSGMDIEIDNYDYWLGSAAGYFGMSGGGVFTQLDGQWYFIGVPSRIRVAFVGFNVDVVTHMGYFIPPHRIHKWLEDVCYQYLYDPSYTKAQCDKMRDERKADEIRKLLAAEGTA